MWSCNCCAYSKNGMYVLFLCSQRTQSFLEWWLNQLASSRVPLTTSISCSSAMWTCSSWSNWEWHFTTRMGRDHLGSRPSSLISGSVSGETSHRAGLRMAVVFLSETILCLLVPQTVRLCQVRVQFYHCSWPLAVGDRVTQLCPQW